MNHLNLTADVIIIGAGPSGSIAAALLNQQGYSALILEKSHFPRFSIGESLLPQCVEFIEQAGMLESLKDKAADFGFQFKNGAAFERNGEYNDFDFTKKFTPGPGTVFQVRRGDFDKLLADCAQEQGVEIRYGFTIEDVDLKIGDCQVEGTTDQQQRFTAQSRFVLDASGFARVLPRLLNLNRPSNFPVRYSLFTHVRDNFTDFDRDKILVTVHPDHADVWFWTIPFADGISSLGVVATPEFFENYPDMSLQTLQAIVKECPSLATRLADAEYINPVQNIKGYSADVTSLSGDGWALLGNAGEFLDPVFSSGVTIAMKSASLASDVLSRELAGKKVDWPTEYEAELRFGVDTFRTFVEAWYDGRFQEVAFAKTKSEDITAMISSILAGYAWDRNNPYVAESKRRLNVLAELCKVAS